MLAGFGLLMGVANPAWAQKQIKDKETVAKEFAAKEQRHKALMHGDAQPTAADKAVADAAAEWYILRVNWRFTGDAHKHFEKVQQDFATAISQAIPIKTNSAYLKMFSAALVKQMRVILAEKLNEDPTSIVNGCMMMPTMAKLKQEAVADFLIELIKDDKTSDVARLYGLKAMQEFMPIRQQEDDVDLKDKSRLEKIRLDAKCVDALVKYIERPHKADALSPEQVTVIQYLRREAIASLARSGSPAVIALKKPAKLDGPIAPTLLKVLGKDVLTPPPSLPEKIEAALGLCAMKFKDMPEYEPELAVYFVGRTIEEFVKEYQGDYGNFAAKGVERKLPKIAWKADAKRFETGLSDLVKNTGDGNAPGARAKADALKASALPLLKAMDKYGFQDNQKVLEIGKQVQRYATKSGVVFKSSPTISVPLPP